MASIFWDSQGVVIIDYLEQGCTLNGAYACESRCSDRKSQERGEVLTRSVLFLQDNAPPHTSQVAMTEVTECGFEILPHSPYSPGLTPSDFYLFPKLKSHLHGTQYGRKF